MMPLNRVFDRVFDRVLNRVLNRPLCRLPVPPLLPAFPKAAK
jgi:hypothetical protein